MTTPESNAQEQIRQLEDALRDIRKEIEMCHAVLDGARVAMPDDYERLTDDEKQRALGLVGRITQAVLIWNGCPLKLAQGKA